MRIRIISFLNEPFKAEIANIDINIDSLAEYDIFETLFTSLNDRILIDLVHNCNEYEEVDYFENEEPVEYEETIDTLLHHLNFKSCLINKALEAKRFEEINSYFVIQNPYMRQLEFS